MLTTTQLSTMAQQAMRDPDADINMLLLDLITEYEDLVRVNAELTTALQEAVDVCHEADWHYCCDMAPCPACKALKEVKRT